MRCGMLEKKYRQLLSPAGTICYIIREVPASTHSCLPGLGRKFYYLYINMKLKAISIIGLLCLVHVFASGQSCQNPTGDYVHTKPASPNYNCYQVHPGGPAAGQSKYVHGCSL